MDTSEKIVTGGIILAGGALAAYGLYESAPILSDVFRAVTDIRDPQIQQYLKMVAMIGGGILGSATSWKIGKYIGGLELNLDSNSGTPSLIQAVALMAASLGLIGLTIGGAYGGWSLMDSLLEPKEKEAQTSRLDTTNVNYVHKLTI